MHFFVMPFKSFKWSVYPSLFSHSFMDYKYILIIYIEQPALSPSIEDIVIDINIVFAMYQALF